MAEGNGQPLDPWFEGLVGDIRRWHAEVLAQSGGAAGEHTARLLASVGRAFQSAFGKPLYTSELEQAAAIFHGIITSHAFVDGNKRTAIVTVFFFLGSKGQLTRSPSPLQVRMMGEIAIETARSNLTVDDVIQWLHRVLDPPDE